MTRDDTYSENHTTRLSQSIVEVMASSGRVVINPEDLRDGNGTLRRALELWSCRNGPVRYNEWQSVFFQLAKRADLSDEDAPEDESLSVKQRRVRELFNEIQEACHGPDHMAVALSLIHI